MKIIFCMNHEWDGGHVSVGSSLCLNFFEAVVCESTDVFGVL